MLITILLFLLGFALLIKGGDWFVDSATEIAHHFHVSELIIGATVVSIGTTLPEVMVSSLSAVTGHGEIAYGNAIGSIICNTALISAITMAVRPSAVNRKSLFTPVAFFFSAAAIYVFVACYFRHFSRLFGGVFLAIFVAFIVTSIIQARSSKAEEHTGTEESKPMWKSWLWLVIGAAAIAGGAKLLVDSATVIARSIGISEAVIGLTLVALGTSLPELTTAVIALVKGHSALSVGNIIGANLFNIVLVSGVSVSLAPFDIPADKIIAGIPSSLLVDTPVMFAVMSIMAFPALLCGKLFRIQGILLLCIYTAYCIFLFCF